MFLVNEKEKEMFSGEFALVFINEDAELCFKVYCDGVIDDVVLSKINHYAKSLNLRNAFELGQLNGVLAGIYNYEFSSDKIEEKKFIEELLTTLSSLSGNYNKLLELVNKSPIDLDACGFCDGYPFEHSLDESSLEYWVDNLSKKLSEKIVF